MRALRLLLSIFFILLYLCFTVLIASSILFFGTLIYLLPKKSWRHKATTWLLKLPVYWAMSSGLLLRLSPNHQWEIRGEGKLDPNGWYMLIANHQTWLDILLLDSVFNRKIPLIKFFMKKELLWSLPFAGLACWFLGYPFMQRHSRKEIQKNPALKTQDIETTKKACERIKEFPTTMMSFLEGTRFTPEKHKRQASPFLHLLKPKAGGVAMVINELRDCLRGIVNVTIYYSNPKIDFLKFLLGQPCKIIVHYEVLPITADIVGDYNENREFRVYFQQWLNLIWERKDLLLDDWRQREK